MTRTLQRSLALLIGAAFITLAAAGAWADDASTAQQILKTAEVRSGLCVYIGGGQGSSTSLPVELAAASRLLVHALAADDVSLAQTRKAVEARRLEGRVIVEKLPAGPLPHLRDLASLVVVADPAGLERRGITQAEIERIVAPAGVVCTADRSRWIKKVKPRPAEMDDWTHPNHGPDGNRVSADRVLRFPVGVRWQDGLPMNFNLWAACRGWVLSGNRLFTLSTSEPENLAPVSFGKHKQEEYLAARDAFNGLPLWKVNCETTNDGAALNNFNIAALATDGKRVFAYKKDHLAAFDAETGREVQTYPVKHRAAQLIVAGGVLVCSSWQEKEGVKEPGKDAHLWSPWGPKAQTGAVEAFDVDSGKRKWALPQPAREMLAAEGVAYLLVQSGNPPSQQDVVAVDLHTGRPRWKAEHAKVSKHADLHLNCAGGGVVVVARLLTKAISVLSAGDGKVLWQINPAGSLWTPLVDGALWNGNMKYDLRTGAPKGNLASWIDSHVCTPNAVIGDYVTASRGCGYVNLGLDGGKRAEQLRWGGARGGCIEGSVPANGMFYTSQNFCRCAPGQLPGFVGYGPIGTEPVAADFERIRPVEKGEAFGSQGAAEDKGDWPTFLHDAARSASSPSRTPRTLSILWQTQAARPASGPLADAWAARLTACAAGPVVAEGKAFISATDAGQIVALDAADGKPAWRATVGGRIDSPPTIHRGLCLFGSHDGWVYALDARSGKLAWRTRVAPAERKMVAFGQVESVWPAPGSVAAVDGVVYATAGRTTESDGGLALCALAAKSGAAVWAKQLGPGPMRVNDLLALRDGKLALHHVKIDPKVGAAKPENIEGAVSLEGIIDGTWTRIGNRRSGNLRFGRAVGEMLAWNDATLFGYEGPSRALFALPKAKAPGSEKDKLTAKDYTWRVPMPPQHQAEAMVVAADALVLAGRVVEPKSGAVSGFVLIADLQTGKTIAESPLESPPVYQGLALAGNRLYLALQNGDVICLGEHR